jgi:phosphatidylglycerophosphatase A
MTQRSLSSRLALTVASVGYAGYFPFAPGTVGSAVAVPLWFLLRWSGWRWAEPVAILALCLIGAWSARLAERELGVEDPGIVVIDEVVGLLISVLWLPLTWQVALAGFVAFRVCDIVKPFPANRLERVPHGWGVMLDDVMAGVYAWLIVRAALWLKPEWLT